MDFTDLINCRTADEVREAILNWSSDKSKEEHLIRSAILENHALIEKFLKIILYESLVDILCNYGSKKTIEKCKKELNKAINGISFSQIYRILKSSFDAFDSPDLKNIPHINETRNLAVHGDIEKTLYKKRNLYHDHDALAQFFFEGWAIRQQLSKFYEVIIDSHRFQIEKLVEHYKKTTNK